MLRETEFDFARWIVYGIILLALALASFVFEVALWIFAIVLAIAIVDIIYVRYFKGRVWTV
ncbi:MAG: hypothetical protein QW063_00165 [Candidatus Nanoarchaeia archaeon]